MLVICRYRCQVRSRCHDYSFLTWNWVLSAFRILVLQMERDWWLDLNLLRLIIGLLRPTLIPIRLLLLLIMRPLWVKLCCILVSVLVPLNRKFVLQHIVHVGALYSCLQFYSGASCHLILRTPTAIGSLQIDISIEILHYRHLLGLLLFNEGRNKEFATVEGFECRAAALDYCFIVQGVNYWLEIYIVVCRGRRYQNPVQGGWFGVSLL